MSCTMTFHPSMIGYEHETESTSIHMIRPVILAIGSKVYITPITLYDPSSPGAEPNNHGRCPISNGLVL